MFIFFNLTFFPLFLVGLLGQPRRVFEYARNLQTLNDWASISAFLLGGSILIFVVNFVMSTLFWRVPETANPWRSRSLEWQLSSPPPPGNFERVPVILSGPYDYGVKDAPPVADLNPPPGVVAAAYAAATLGPPAAIGWLRQRAAYNRLVATTIRRPAPGRPQRAVGGPVGRADGGPMPAPSTRRLQERRLTRWGSARRVDPD